jgi:ABC-2 type transport system permease protein
MRSANAPAAKDADMLLSLPIRRTVVILSKVVTQYIFDGPLILLIFIPSVVSYYAMAVRDPAMLVRGLVLAFLLPLLPIAVSYLLGALISILREKFRMTGILTTIVLMLVVVGYMFINFQSSGLLSQVSDGGKVNSAAIIGSFLRFHG